MSSSSSDRRMPGGPFSDGALELVAERFAILAEPRRLRLLRALLAGEKPVHVLTAETGGTQTNVSRHLHALTQARILSRRRVGLQVYYAIADPTVFTLCDLACGSLERQLLLQAGVFCSPPREGRRGPAATVEP